MFDTLVKYMYENLNDFGEIIAADGKAIQKVTQEEFQRKTAITEERGMPTGVKRITQQLNLTVKK